MAQSKIEDIIEDIYQFIEGCKMAKFSSTTVMVPKDDLYYLMDELREKIPDEVHRYQKVITNREAITEKARREAEQLLEAARKQADQIIEGAKKQAELLVNESAIVKDAYAKANNVIENATLEANDRYNEAMDLYNQICSGAYEYTADMLASTEEILLKSYNEAVENYKGLTESLIQNLQIVQQNQRELPGFDVEAEIERQRQMTQEANYEDTQETLYENLDLQEEQ